MKPMDLLEAFGELPEEYIVRELDYEPPRKHTAFLISKPFLAGVSTAACLQLDAAIPNFAIQEFPSFYHQGSEAQMTKEPIKEDGGYIIIPDAPGIGIELVDDICERFPEAQRSISAQTAYDGSVYDV